MQQIWQELGICDLDDRRHCFENFGKASHHLNVVVNVHVFGEAQVQIGQQLLKGQHETIFACLGYCRNQFSDALDNVDVVLKVLSIIFFLLWQLAHALIFQQGLDHINYILQTVLQ